MATASRGFVTRHPILLQLHTPQSSSVHTTHLISQESVALLSRRGHSVHAGPTGSGRGRACGDVWRTGWRWPAARAARDRPEIDDPDPAPTWPDDAHSLAPVQQPGRHRRRRIGRLQHWEGVTVGLSRPGGGTVTRNRDQHADTQMDWGQIFLGTLAMMGLGRLLNRILVRTTAWTW